MRPDDSHDSGHIKYDGQLQPRSGTKSRSLPHGVTPLSLKKSRREDLHTPSAEN
jgi:hypothetical protein